MKARIEVPGRARAPAPAALNDRPALSHDDYKAQLRELRVELVKLQRHCIECGGSIQVQLEGRDTLSLRTHSVVAPWHIVKTNDKRLAR